MEYEANDLDFEKLDTMELVELWESVAGPVSQERLEKKVRSGIQTILYLGILHILLGGLLGYFEGKGYSEVIDSYQGMAGDEIVSVDGGGMTVIEATSLYEFLRILALAIPIGIGVIFLVLHRLARKKTHLALFLALLFYVGLTGLDLYLAEPDKLMSGMGISIFVIIILASAIRNGQSLRALEASE